MTLDSKNQMNELMTEISTINQEIAEQLNNVSCISEQLAESVNTAVRSLQFEDMTSQLAEHMRARLTELESFLHRFSILPNELGAKDSNKEALADRFYTLKHDMEVIFQKHNHKSVTQQSLQQGEVELF